MIVCAQCGKKNKDGATVCKHCGYNPGALQANTMTWGYQNGAYVPMQYQQPPAQQGTQYYYDADGKAYTVRYDYKVTPVEEEDEEEYEEEEEGQQMMLYPYNPTLVQQQAQRAVKEPETPNAMAWVGYFLAMFFDILAWPFCWIGLLIAKKRDGAKKEVCIGGMLFTLMRVLSAAILFLIWWIVSTYIPSFFTGMEDWEAAVAKIIFFGWPVAIGSIFTELSPNGSALKIAGKGFFLFSIVVAVIGIIFFDMAWLHIFS